MGTDIHAYGERRTDAGWESLNPLDLIHTGESDLPEMSTTFSARDYTLFAMLNGIHADHPDVAISGEPYFLALPDGYMPPDLGPQLAALVDAWTDLGAEYHSAGAATLADLQARDWTGIEDPSAWQACLDALASAGPAEDVRLVWWFDN